MAESAHDALKAVAFQLLEHLDLYERQLANLADAWPDADLLQAVRDAVDVMRAHAASLPQMTGAWVEFLISHTEVIRALAGSGDAGRARLDLIERHTGHLLEVEAWCLALATGRRPDA